MGYRHYLEVVNKEEVESIRKLNKEELVNYIKSQGRSLNDEDEEDGFDYISFENAFSKIEVCFEFGKLYFCDTAKQIEQTGFMLFDDKELRREFGDYRPFVVGKDAVLKAIEIYTKRVIDCYKECLKEPNDKNTRTVEEKCKREIQSHLNWCRNGIIDIDEKRKYELANTWLYEHSIFNLGLILKTLDWDKYCLIFRGW